MKWQQFVKDYLTFSRRDRIGAISVLALLLLIYLLPHIFTKSETTPFIKRDTTLQAALDTLESQKSLSHYRKQEEKNFDHLSYEASETAPFSGKGELFNFDPNTLPIEGWRRLGLNGRVLQTINNYRTKGGKFYKPEDVLKIWGMPEDFYERVKDYISITHDATTAKSNTEVPLPEKKKPERTVININTADTTAFIALPGIGSKLSNRIVAFRNKLGGFYSVEQLKETYGLPDSTFQKIKPYLQADASNLKKINLNMATKDELKNHPYIKWNLANVIIEYRNQHGPFTSVEDLKKIVLIDEATFEKIAPYVSLN